MNTGMRPRILCVDDDLKLLRSLRWLLKSHYEVDLAEGGEQGLEAIIQRHYDVIISDQRMPGMTGTEFLRQARQLAPHSMRLLLTGYSDFPLIVSSVNESEVFRFISKPWNNQKLLATVAEAVRAARATDTLGPMCMPLVGEVELSLAQEQVLVYGPDKQVGELVERALRGAMRPMWSDDMGEMLNAVAARDVAVLIHDVDEVDPQRMALIRAVRQQHPAVVVMIYSELKDSNSIAQLINEGQVFRYITKPTTPMYLRHQLMSGLARHREIRGHPELAARHVVATADPSPPAPIKTLGASPKDPDAPSCASPTPMARSWLARLLG